ncbi:hypothetical protein INT48_004950 [Thamnidium elegans]|uniref:Uncharacterized protein n=1 Tax=Thamnidium elegans TaxID=101142 RepID=A0A8H7SUL4_9FUNG|nr:hypothetical protein INT48_004950 [Thamnidium elegans]
MESTNLLSQDVEQQQQARSVRFDSEQKDYKYYLVWFWRFCIFGLVGSSSMKVTRLLLTGLTNDVWYYYAAFFFAELFVYTVMIITVGSLLGQWKFFCFVGYKMWSWIMPLKLKIWCYEHLHSDTISV